MVLASCSYDPTELSAEEIRVMQAPIVNGVMDNGHLAVGRLMQAGAGYCTATLVGSHTVLTAAHCVVNEKNAPYTLRQQLSWSPDGSTGKMVPVVQAVYHSAFHRDAISGGLKNDVAVLRLGQEVTDIPLMQITKTPPQQGESVTLVGFGYTSDNATDSGGVKRRAQNSIGKVMPLQIVFYGATGQQGNICFGDSGGPALANRNGQEELVGVHSWGEAACGVAEHDARVDIHYQWIENQAQGNLHQSPTQGTSPNQDTQPPQISILTPTSQATVAQSFAVEVNVKDDGVIKRVELLIDGQSFANMQAPPYSFNVNNMAPGRHNLRAEAVDEAGRRGSTLVQINVQWNQSSPPPSQQPPSSSWTDPPPVIPAQVSSGCSLGGTRSGPSSILVLLLLLGVSLLTRRRYR